MWLKSVVLQSQKKLQVLEKNYFRKKIFSNLFVYDLQNIVRKFFLNKWVSRYLRVWVILRFRKIALCNKIIKKTWSTKDQENSVHRFGDNCLTNHVVKFLQDRINPEELELLEYALVITFFILTIVIKAYCVNCCGWYKAIHFKIRSTI